MLDHIVSMMVIADDQEKSTIADANILRSYLHQIEDSMSEQVKSWNLFKSLGPSPEKMTAVFNEEQILSKYVADSCLIASTRISKIHRIHTFAKRVNCVGCGFQHAKSQHKHH